MKGSSTCRICGRWMEEGFDTEPERVERETGQGHCDGCCPIDPKQVEEAVAHHGCGCHIDSRPETRERVWECLYHSGSGTIWEDDPVHQEIPDMAALVALYRAQSKDLEAQQNNHEKTAREIGVDRTRTNRMLAHLKTRIVDEAVHRAFPLDDV